MTKETQPNVTKETQPNEDARQNGLASQEQGASSSPSSSSLPSSSSSSLQKQKVSSFQERGTESLQKEKGKQCESSQHQALRERHQADKQNEQLLAQKIFFQNQDWDEGEVGKLTHQALLGCDDGELFLEHHLSEDFLFSDNRLKAASYDTVQGFGLRGICQEAVGYAHSTRLSKPALQDAADIVKAVRKNHQGQLFRPKSLHPKPLYIHHNPLSKTSFQDKIALLENMNDYARKKNSKVRQVSIRLTGNWQAIGIVRGYETPIYDIRPLVQLTVSVMLGHKDRQEVGFSGRGGRALYAQYLTQDNWQSQIDEAIRQAHVNLESQATPAGEKNVVLGKGWPGILLHEAVGHGLEADFHRKKVSVFTGRIGKQVATKGVTVVDDGTLPFRRGSLTIDDEGTKSQKNILIEDGILRALMQDRHSARLLKTKPTGNGRRESFAHKVLPRMTNTYMEAGDYAPEEIIESVKDGLYAVSFGGGQVDITSGKFVFSCTEAYEIKNGKLGAPLKGATLIGSGIEAMGRITMVGNDKALDHGVGLCGKDGQTVPVGVGQPTLRLDGITVGGTN